MTGARAAALFLDVGGVLLTNGWDHGMRRAAAERFGLDREEFEERHRLPFEAYELGKADLDAYLDAAVFYVPRGFSRDAFKAFMFAQSQPHPEMLALVRAIKRRGGIKIYTVNNEGRDLNVHRIRTFGLGEFVDAFVSSCAVHLRKPDPDIWRLALDLAQVPAERTVYVDDRAALAEVARGLGMHGVHHTGYPATRAALAAQGLVDGR